MHLSQVPAWTSSQQEALMGPTPPRPILLFIFTNSTSPLLNNLSLSIILRWKWVQWPIHFYLFSDSLLLFFVLLHTKSIKKHDQQLSNLAFSSSEGIWSLRDLSFLRSFSIADNPPTMSLPAENAQTAVYIPNIFYWCLEIQKLCIIIMFKIPSLC